MFLHNPRQWPRAIFGVIATFGKPIHRRFAQFDFDITIGKLGIKLHDKFINNQPDDIFAKRRERNNRIKPVTEFRRKHFLDGFNIGAFIMRTVKSDCRF